MITNPNRFIRGLADISDIVDNDFDIGQTVTTAPATPVGVVTTPTAPVVTQPSTPSAFSLIEVEFTIATDGGTTHTLSDSGISNTMLFINGLLQSKSAYTVTGVTLVLPPSLNLFTGDAITFVYTK